MKKKAQVHLLPSSTYTPYGLILRDADKVLTRHSDVARWHGQDQHLYISVDEKIEIGNWFINSITSKPMYNNDKLAILFGDRKIIATTNPNLWYKDHDDEVLGRMQTFKLSDEFIHDYIKSYNKDNVIKEITVEYVEYSTDSQFPPVIIKPMYNSDGTIVIESMKETKDINTKALEALAEELNKSGLRKYTCLNDFGYSQVERNIVSRILALNTSVEEKMYTRDEMMKAAKDYTLDCMEVIFNTNTLGKVLPYYDTWFKEHYPE